MLDPQGLYQLSDELPELGRPVLIQALAGFVDAGHAGRLAREHLLGTAGAQVVATFDIDQLMDYRSRRPSMIFVEDHWESYDEPALTVHLLRDATDAPYLLLSGPEPDLQWERFILAMLSLVRQLSVRVTVGMNAIPMGVPHTRPTGVTAHATRPELISGYEPWLSRVQVPGGAGNLLEYRLGQHGQDAIGFAVHVPHYLAQAEYPAASVELLASVCRATGLNLSFDALRTAAERVRSEVDRQVSQSEEATAVVRALEEQYDAFLRGRASNLLGSIGPGDPAASRLPTADELGAELERFLAEHAKPDDPGT